MYLAKPRDSHGQHLNSLFFPSPLLYSLSSSLFNVSTALRMRLSSSASAHCVSQSAHCLKTASFWRRKWVRMASSNPRGRENTVLSPIKPLTLQWFDFIFSLQYHPYIKHEGHKNQGNDHQVKKLLIITLILLFSTLENVQRTRCRICILVLWCGGFAHKITNITCVIAKSLVKLHLIVKIQVATN